MKTRIPDENGKHEMAGRMYEAVDLERAIEDGELKTVPEILEAVKKSSKGLSKVLECSQWVYTDSGCLDVQATLAAQG